MLDYLVINEYMVKTDHIVAIGLMVITGFMVVTGVIVDFGLEIAKHVNCERNEAHRPWFSQQVFRVSGGLW